jgi:hypothetical protein
MVTTRVKVSTLISAVVKHKWKLEGMTGLIMAPCRASGTTSPLSVAPKRHVMLDETLASLHLYFSGPLYWLRSGFLLLSCCR